MKKTLANYEKIIGSVAISKLRQTARELKGASVVHVNSTREGGGVAEILFWMIPLMKELGLDVSWEVIEGNSKYFNTTKTFHNGLQGTPVDLTDQMIKDYEDTVTANADRIRTKLQEADFVFIHDPQPAYLYELCPDKKGKWIWRCHIDVSRPNRKVWNYLKSKVNNYDSSIFSMPTFAQRLDHPQFIIAPSIDPISEKNIDLSDQDIDGLLQQFDIDRDRPILCQISRFDRFKDPIGVIEAFKLLNGVFNTQLILAGGGATDDPEGSIVLEEVKSAANDSKNIKILMLPSDSHRLINAIQRAATVVIQKSLQEGFGLTVTEAMWKRKPVIGGNVGGIRLQVHNHYTGFLVDTPEGASLRLRQLLHQPSAIEKMGNTAKAFVKENYLCNRQ